MPRVARIALLASALVGCCFAASAQIKWMTMEEALAAHAKAPKKILVDVYTDWCGWCKRMDATTFKDAEVARLVNRDFYAVKFDAEQSAPVAFAGKTYEFVAGGRRGAHALARKLLRGRMGYPTVVFLDEDLRVIEPVPGYQDAAAMRKIVDYFGTETYKTIPWAQYAGE